MMQLRHIFSFWSLFHLVKSISPAARIAEEIFTAFSRSGSLSSETVSRVSQCFANSVNINLPLISVSPNENFERFVPRRTRPIAWTRVNLGRTSGIRDCARIAQFLGALMFKFENGCSVALTDAYNPATERSCSDFGRNVVYISSRVKRMNFFGGIPVAGNSIGCDRRTTSGWTYGVEDGRPVNEITLPPRETECISAASDFCLVAECSDEPMTYCEAEARCLARGLRPASRFFHENVDAVDPLQLGTAEYYFWVSVYQGQDEVWRWQDDASLLSEFVWCGGGGTPPPSANCAAVHFTDEPHKIEYYRTSCTGCEVKCILCYDPNSLPKI